MTISYRPLSEVKMMLEEAGTDVSYAYEDLVFADHTAYIIQFDDVTPSNLKIFFNTELDELKLVEIGKRLTKVATKRKMTIIPSGKFKLTQKDESEEIDISFYPIGN